MEADPSDRITVVIFGKRKDNLNVDRLFSNKEVPEYEEKELSVYNFLGDEDLDKIEREIKPNVYVTFGKWERFSCLNVAPYNIRRKWLNFKWDEDLALVGRKAFNLYCKNCFDPPADYPLISAITGAYRTGGKIFRVLESLREQSYKNWEWIIYDDSDDNGETFSLLESVRSLDHRVKIFKSDLRSGRIGQVKRNGFALASGDYLCEIDHDDKVTADCFKWLVQTFEKYPDVGMAYTDCTEFIEATGECVNYGDDYAFGYGSYRKEFHNGREFLVTNYPNLNQYTIRHIVGVANHVRCWRSSTYHAIGGHNPQLHVADDYELIVRTFLKSRIAHIPKLGYIQYVNNDASNTTDKRRPEIQRLVRMVSGYYDKQIHERLLELGLPDDLWIENEGRSQLYDRPTPPSDKHACIIADV
jgi:glycosyltransferase involved in cell wall biosynthesis